MFAPGTPLEVAAVIAAVGWPLAAGLALVVWSKMRAAARARREAAIEGDLKDLYQSLEQRPAPDKLMLVLDALEEGAALAPQPREAVARTREAAD